MDTLSDAPGNGNSLVASGSTLRKLLGQDGIDVITQMTSMPDGSYSSELLISGSTLLDAIANLTSALAGKQDAISVISPLPSFDYVFGLGEALTSASQVVVDIAGVTGLTDALAAKQIVLAQNRPWSSKVYNAL